MHSLAGSYVEKGNTMSSPITGLLSEDESSVELPTQVRFGSGSITAPGVFALRAVGSSPFYVAIEPRAAEVRSVGGVPNQLRHECKIAR
jgi:hypothetical protein